MSEKITVFSKERNKPSNIVEMIDELLELIKKDEEVFCVEEKFCLYRNKDNSNGCFIGRFIPDEIIPERNRPIATLIHENSKISEYFLGFNSYDLGVLQQIHDCSYTRGTKERSIKALTEFRESLI